MSYWSTIEKLKCPKCGEFNFLDIGDTQDLTLPDSEGCLCWSCHHAFDFEGNVKDLEDCDKGQRLVEIDDQLIKDAESWRWIKGVVEQTGYIDFGVLSHPPGPGYGYEFCSPAQAGEFWTGKEWKPIGMASQDNQPSTQHRRKRR
jgi:hypothetical protein